MRRGRRRGRGLLLVEVLTAFALLALTAAFVGQLLITMMRTGKSLDTLSRRAATVQAIERQVRVDSLAARGFRVEPTGELVCVTRGGDVRYVLDEDAMCRRIGGQPEKRWPLGGLELRMTPVAENLLELCVRNRGREVRGPQWDRTTRTTLRAMGS